MQVGAMVKRRAGIFGAFAYSGANFLLAFVVQASVSSSDFGLYAFALVLIQLGVSVSNALFAAPMVIDLADPKCAQGILLRSYFNANLVFIAVSASLVLTVLGALGLAWSYVFLFALQAVFLWMRWFVRAIELAQRQFLRPALADGVYGLVAGLAALTLWGLVPDRMGVALIAMLLGTIASLLLMGFDVIPLIIRSKSSIAPFLQSLQRHGGWALIGVLTTEITANFHSYFLTVWFGPAAFAPVATLSLFFRPIPILMQSLTQYERPILARLLKDGAREHLSKDVRHITGIMTGAVVSNSLLVAAVLLFAHQMIGNGQYFPKDLWLLAALIGAGQLVRGWRTGPSAAAQGGGEFRALAYATLIAAPITCAGTFAAWVIGWQVVPMVLVAVLIGETVNALLIQRTFSRLVNRGIFA